MCVRHAALLKLKHPAVFLIMQLVLGLIILRVDLARLRLPLIISLLPKKDRTCFSHTVSLYYFSLSRKQWVWMTISNYYQNSSVKYQN